MVRISSGPGLCALAVYPEEDSKNVPGSGTCFSLNIPFHLEESGSWATVKKL